MNRLRISGAAAVLAVAGLSAPLVTAQAQQVTPSPARATAPVQQIDVAKAGKGILDTVRIRKLAEEAYVWGLAPEFVYRFSHYQELVSAPVNSLKYGANESAWNNNGTNAGDASVLYINAFADFNATHQNALVLTVPPTTGQYYVANYLDNFVNGIGSIGNRTTPSARPTSYILVPPGSPAAKLKTLKLGGKTFPVMASDTNLNWLLIRIRANSLVPASDPSSVASVYRNVVQKFALNSFGTFKANGYKPVFPTSYANFTPNAAQVKQAKAWQSAPTKAVPFFQQIGASLVSSPLPGDGTAPSGKRLSQVGSWYIPQYGATSRYVMPGVGQINTLAKFSPIGLTAKGFTVPSNWGPAQLKAFEAGFNAGVKAVQNIASSGSAKASNNYWKYLNNMIGTYPNTAEGYLVRSTVVLAGGSANVPLDALYPTMNSNSASGTQLNGNNTYSITFQPPAASYPSSSWPVQGIFPPMVLDKAGKVKGFWSIVVYQPDSKSSSAPFLPQTAALNTAYSDATSTNVVSASAATNSITVNSPAWGPIDKSTPLIFGSNAAAYGLTPGTVYYVANNPVASTSGPLTYTFQLSTQWKQQLSSGNVPIQQSASVGGAPGTVVPLNTTTSALTFGMVQPVSQLGSEQLDAGDMHVNGDGSVTIWLSPTLPIGADAHNWIPTPNTTYYDSLYGPSSGVSTDIQAMIRMYYPTPGNTPPSILPYSSNVKTTYTLPALVTVP